MRELLQGYVLHKITDARYTPRWTSPYRTNRAAQNMDGHGLLPVPLGRGFHECAFRSLGRGGGMCESHSDGVFVSAFFDH